MAAWPKPGQHTPRPALRPRPDRFLLFSRTLELNVPGLYSFAALVQVSGLRPLRAPDAAGLDDDGQD